MGKAFLHKVEICVLLAFFLSNASGSFAAILRHSSDPNDFVSARLQHFWVNGQPFRFVGYNLRGLVQYGDPSILPDSQPSDQEPNLTYMENVGAKVARVFMSSRFADNQTLSDRLDAALQAASQHNIRLIVVFTDEYFSNFCPKGDEVYYGYLGNGILNQLFFSGGYQNNYLPLVESVVSRFKDDPTVFAWQLGNELKCPWSPTSIITFCHDVAGCVRSIDPNHMVSYGTAGSGFSGLSSTAAQQLYQDFDFLTIHVYNGDESLNDAPLADELRKPLLVSEAGFDTDNPDRPAATDADIAKWIGRGARGYMNWGLMLVDNGDGDDIFGIDPFGHSYDWEAYTNVYKKWAGILATTPLPAPDPPQNVTATDGTWPDRVIINWDGCFAATEYAVFRAATPTGTKTQVSPWQSGKTFTDRPPVPGYRYLYWLKARNSGGESAYSVFDVGYSNNAPQVSIAQAKAFQNNLAVYVTGGVVTAAFADRFYIGQEDRAAGLCIQSNAPVAEGDCVNVLGTLSVSPAGERMLSALSVIPQP